MKLIASMSSPFVRKVRIVLAEKKIDYETVLENVWAADTGIGRYNPLGQVPALQLDDGEVIYDSRVICEFLDTLTPVGKLIPPTGRERAAVRCAEALADGVLNATVLTRLETVLREPAQYNADWVARQRLKVSEGVAGLARGLGEKPWYAQNHLTLADVALGCALGYLDFRQPDFDWRTAHPNLARHFAKLSQRQSFIDTVPPAA
ncbi:glutathione S-transferase N-terminal domain-containing protein [Chitinasiproducens palmae]|uniref:Glutathione S-transferase n=1 Tax=Chitinasiproducens palmae TaxID=1770053 RepID=A0A1H2PRI0_9BURK|nr:glutathione S-transferase N-terminal domain-containing protein [Chitinasiproducens palmae]SDV49509.1 glutathione S-transferase [Chitinasiproducens palmae]